MAAIIVNASGLGCFCKVARQATKNGGKKGCDVKQLRATNSRRGGTSLLLPLP